MYLELPPGVAGKLRIWSVDGKIMHQQGIEELSGQRLSVKTLEWPSGIYFCSLYKQNGEMEHRVTLVVILD